MIPELTPAEVMRFYSKIRVGGCGMLWDGPVNNHGYGQFEIYRNGKRIRILAHRLSYKLVTGADPVGSKVRHRCDTPPCVTPDCLLRGTQADNVHDALERGRLDTSGLAAYSRERDERAAARIETGKKRCSRCDAVKDLEQFFRARANVDGRSYWCKECAIEHQRVYRADMSERERAALPASSPQHRKAAA